MQSSIGPSANGARLAEADSRKAPVDVREVLLAPLAGKTFQFAITAAEPAILAGSFRLAEKAQELGLQLDQVATDGDRLMAGSTVCRARAGAAGLARAEEQLIGLIGKASGVATAAAELVAISRGRSRIVCGAWKKVPAEIRLDLRDAAALGGAGIRMLDRPFVYLDKNHVRMLGGVVRAVRQARLVEGRAIVVQLRGDGGSIADEAEAAAAEGAEMLMVDTGRVADLLAVAERVRSRVERHEAQLAFGGGVRAAHLESVIEAGAHVVDVGRAILDAPMVDFRLDVG